MGSTVKYNPLPEGVPKGKALRQNNMTITNAAHLLLLQQIGEHKVKLLSFLLLGQSWKVFFCGIWELQHSLGQLVPE